MFDNTSLLIILVKEFKKAENQYNGYLNDLLTKAIDKEANHDYMDLDICKLKKELNICKCDEIEPYFNNLLEVICERDLLISERNYYQRAYDD